MHRFLSTHNINLLLPVSFKSMSTIKYPRNRCPPSAMLMHQYMPIPAFAQSGRDDPVDHVEENLPTVLRKRSLSLKPTCGVLLLLSLLANAVFITSLVGSKHSTEDPERSKFAGLARTVPKPWTLNRPGNETAWNELWDQHSNYDHGVLALDDAYALAMDLPRAQRWPWDANKGIYIINSYHNLHCVKQLRSSLEEFRSSSPQSSPWEHVQHCLLVLRDEIMCNADDTPRYSGYQPSQSTGLGQMRMCRDWSALDEWARDKERSGCWRHIPGEVGVNGFSILERYRFCPEGSRYEEMARTSWLNEEE